MEEFQERTGRSSPKLMIPFTRRGVTSAARVSTVHRGAAFEERSMSILRHDMSMSLNRVGGKDDGGVDFLGWWWLPHDSPNEPYSSLLQRRRIRIIGQCKAEKKKIGPHYIRELEGVLYRFLTQQTDLHPAFFDGDMKTEEKNSSLTYDSSPAIAVLVSQSAFTKSTILRANSSPIPFCLLHLPLIEGTDSENSIEQPEKELSGKLGSVWCNPALCGAKGLLKGRLEVRWERHLENAGARPALWWDGTRLPNWVPVPSLGTNFGMVVESPQRSGNE